ncbi:MAG: pyrroline-5-carboxylate reductase [Oscillospiraceae bacterium]
MDMGFIGFGNMAQAIAKGIVGKKAFDSFGIFAYNPTPSKITSFNEACGSHICSCQSASEVVKKAHFVFLCVKPQVLKAVLCEVRAAICDDTVIVSIVAGVTSDKIRAIIEKPTPIVRTMPNTPLLLGQGTTAFSHTQDVSEADYQTVKQIFLSIGTVYEIPEISFNEVIPVNGSSPAFIYLLAKQIAKNAERHGLDYTDSLHMFADTLIGSAHMILESGNDIDKLITMVCSKGGTTLAALDTLNRCGFENSIDKAFDSCIERAYELGKSE